MLALWKIYIHSEYFRCYPWSEWIDAFWRLLFPESTNEEIWSQVSDHRSTRGEVQDNYKLEFNLDCKSRPNFIRSISLMITYKRLLIYSLSCNLFPPTYLFVTQSVWSLLTFWSRTTLCWSTWLIRDIEVKASPRGFLGLSGANEYVRMNNFILKEI